MAIQNRKQLEHTRRRIAELELTLEEMKREESPTAYAIMSKGFVAQIEQMRREIDEYLGISGEKVEEEHNQVTTGLRPSAGGIHIFTESIP